MTSIVSRFSLKRRTVALATVLMILLGTFIYVGLRSGPLAPVAVTVSLVQERAITPAVFGIGTVQARYTHAIGPIAAGRLASLKVDVGDLVQRGQVLGEMEPVDLDHRIAAQDATIERVRATVSETRARLAFAHTQAERYQQLFAVKSTSQEIFASKQQELRLAQAGLDVATQELTRAQAEREGLQAQRENLRLKSPVDGLVVKRDVEPGSTVVAGQTVVEVIDPHSLWIHARFDQIRATGLERGQSAEIALRSRTDQILSGEVLRVEPLADSVTEELLAKVSFLNNPTSRPPVGELAEITVRLPALPRTPSIPVAAIRRDGANAIVWRVVGNSIESVSVTLGAGDLDGNVQVTSGLNPGDQVVTYSESALTPERSIRVVASLPGATP